MDGPVQHFRTAILEAWHFHVFSRLSERKVFGEWNLLISRVLYNYLTRPT